MSVSKLGAKASRNLKLISFITGLILLVTATFLDRFINLANSYLYLLLYLFSYLVLGYSVIKKALLAIVKKRFFDENTLMTIATIGALALGEFLEAIMVMLFYLVGEYFQDLALDKAKNSIEKIISLKPAVAHLKKDNSLIDILPEEVKKGDIIVVKQGEQVPLDGVVMSGVSSIDQRALTGEMVPVEVSRGFKIKSGSLNLGSAFEIKVESEYSDSTISRIIKYTEESLKNKGKTEKMITKFARIYTPIVVIIAFGIAFLGPLIISFITKIPYLTLLIEYGIKGVTFLVVSCPCALVLSVPLTYFAGIGKASKEGILIKNSSVLENLLGVTDVFFDKTGTLTEGEFSVLEVLKYQENSQEEIIKSASHIESFSNHPIANSVLKFYNQKIDSSLVSNVMEIPGQGMKGKYLNDDIVVGNAKILKESHIEAPGSFSNTTLYVAKNGMVIGAILIGDNLKEGSGALIADLKKMNIKTTMITGDNQKVALKVAEKLQLDSYYYDCLPLDKVQILENNSGKGKKIFVGDGINDAPSLAKADIGISLGIKSSDIANGASDIILVSENIRKIKMPIIIAKRVQKTVIENIIMALSLKVLAMLLALINVLGPWTMVVAILADVGVTLVAVLNAIRVLFLKTSE